MHARRMPFSGNWVISNWFEEEHDKVIARRKRILQAVLGLFIVIAALAAFGFVVSVAVDATAPKTFGQPLTQVSGAKR